MGLNFTPDQFPHRRNRAAQVSMEMRALGSAIIRLICAIAMLWQAFGGHFDRANFFLLVMIWTYLDRRVNHI